MTLRVELGQSNRLQEKISWLLIWALNTHQYMMFFDWSLLSMVKMLLIVNSY
jgi:hypothetical protein